MNCDGLKNDFKLVDKVDFLFKQILEIGRKTEETLEMKLLSYLNLKRQKQAQKKNL